MGIVAYSKRGEFVARSIAGETILVPVRGRVGDLEAIYNLNDVGGFIWTMLDHKISLAQIVNAVCHEFEVPVEQATEDVSQFLSVLESAGIVEVSEQGD